MIMLAFVRRAVPVAARWPDLLGPVFGISVGRIVGIDPQSSPAEDASAGSTRVNAAP